MVNTTVPTCVTSFFSELTTGTSEGTSAISVADAVDRPAIDLGSVPYTITYTMIILAGRFTKQISATAPAKNPAITIFRFVPSLSEINPNTNMDAIPINVV